MFKRFITSLFCLFLILNCSTFIVFAEGESNVPDGYSPCGLNDQVDAFKSYCQSRNLVVEGSGLDVVTSFTSNAYQGAVRKVGLDINELQNQIYKNTKNNVGAKWFFTQTGISAFNRIFAEFLQNNDLEVGDSANQENNTVYDGHYYTYLNKTCLCFEGSRSNSWILDSNLTVKGTPFPYTTNDLISLGTESGNSVNFPYSSNYSPTWKVYSWDPWTSGGHTYTGGAYEYNSSNGNYAYYIVTDGVLTWYGYPCVFYSSGKYYAQRILFEPSTNKYRCQLSTTELTLGESTVGPATIYLTTNNTTINNNNYEGDTYITNEGDVITNNPEPTPGGQNPGWNVGGGQGSYNDGNGNSYTINFPDFELPDLNIDWSIQGLGNKFPFSIPFDIASLVTVLNAEPEAPRFQGTMDLGITTYNYDIDLSQFDTVASACRIAELLLLVFGLIMITRSIIKG